MESPKNNVNKLLGDKTKIEKEIEQIQSGCSHAYQSLKQNQSDCSHTLKSLKQNQSEIRWYCDECKQPLKYASTLDIDKFFNRN